VKLNDFSDRLNSDATAFSRSRQRPRPAWTTLKDRGYRECRMWAIVDTGVVLDFFTAPNLRVYDLLNEDAP